MYQYAKTGNYKFPPLAIVFITIKYFWITKSKIAEVIGGCINIQRPQVMNSQRLSTEPLLHGSSEVMPLISSFLTMKFKKSSVWL